MLTRLLCQGILVWSIDNRIRHTHCAHLDTIVYSPLCLALAVGAAIVGLAG